ncbi:MAG: nicotinate (nicotinamide) nucleotide adenylyltransferase [Candidatus Omnitrophica bacterium]|nr:nicotinate (nicotinamide) nucleotide adenylyltransferase [Candidatus Omnitrophota bacterium]
MQRIGIFGGSFDPIHQGHLAIARCALEQLSLDRVYFVPAARSPFKQKVSLTVSNADRVAMIRRLIEDNPRFEVSTWELEQGGVSYTVDTLRHFRKEYPDSDCFFLMGEDSYGGFEGWKNPGEIRQLSHLVVAPRTASSGASKMTLGCADQDQPLYLNMPLCDISSTQLRVQLMQARETALAGLPGPVQQYIREHGLYQ